MSQTPLLILSDAPTCGSGLGRITREIAVRAHAALGDVCRIATLGYGGPISRKLNFQQYAIEGMASDWVIPNLPEVWDDWAGNEPGIILAIWDASRLGWFARPEIMCENPVLRQFLTRAKITRWTYSPLDAEGPNGRLAYPLTQCLLGFQRVLAYGPWAEQIMRQSLQEGPSTDRQLTSLPHAIDSAVFHPFPRARARERFHATTGANSIQATQFRPILDDEPLVGTVATNQARKDWGLWAEACALFLQDHPKARFWVHVDQLERHWSIPQLAIDFGLMGRTMVSLGHLEDEQMARAYSACDLTLGIGMAEGWGFPLAESLACGTPVIHVNYGGGAEVVIHPEMLVNPVIFRYEGLFCCKRPVLHAKSVAGQMSKLLGTRTALDSGFYWDSVWPRWEQWFRTGLI